jgi:hypothetical protein
MVEQNTTVAAAATILEGQLAVLVQFWTVIGQSGQQIGKPKEDWSV